MNVLRFISSIVVVFVIGCGSDSTCETADIMDTSAPRVESTSPLIYEVDVAIDAAVTATFNEELDASSVEDTTLQLFPGDSTTPIGATVTYDSATFQVICNPNLNLLSGTLYTAILASSATDLSGNMLVTDVTWYFITADYPRITGSPMLTGPYGPGSSIELSVPVNAVTECVTLTLVDFLGAPSGSGTNCKAAYFDTDIIVNISDWDGFGPHLAEVEATGDGAVSNYFYDDTVSLDNYTWSTAGVSPEDSGIPLTYH